VGALLNGRIFFESHHPEQLMRTAIPCRSCALAVLSAIFVPLLVAIPVAAQTVSVPLTPDRWIIGEKNERIPPGRSLENNGKVVDHLGRPALKLAKGFAYVRDLDLQNGTIDADMAFSKEGEFLGLAFRVQSEDDYELFFLRSGLSGDREGLQYTPSFHGANAWQIYNLPTYAGAGEYPSDDQWFHLRVVVAGLEAKLYLNNATQPSLVIPDLKQGYSRGSIGFWGQSGGGYISNVIYTPDNASYTAELKQEFVPGTLTDWQLSESFDAGDRDPATYPDVRSLKWEKVVAENPGMVVIQRYRRDPNILPQNQPGTMAGTTKIADRVPGSKFVYARTFIHADADQVRKLHIGYSDTVVVYLNGRPVYAGNNTIGAREHGFLGLLNPDNDAVYLQLKEGDNELMLAVTEFFGGWGFICRLDPEQPLIPPAHS
jgi:hypothetical protein